MKAIIHIGSPKAGSTSIQEFLYRNQDELARRGLRYHRNIDHRMSHFEYPLAAMARCDTTLWGETERIRYEARTVEEARASSEPHAQQLKTFTTRFSEPTAVISSEHIMPWLKTPAQVQAQHDMFAEVFDEVTYVVYFRSQYDSVGSRYSERIKRGESIRFDAFVDRQLKFVNYFKIVKRWADVVGKERMNVRLLDRSFLRNGDLISDFCHVCGIDPAGLVEPPRENESLSAPGAECLRALNALVPEIHPEGGDNPLRYDILEAVIEMSAGQPPIAMNADQWARIREASAQSNGKLHRQYFPKRKQLFSTPANLKHAMGDVELRDAAMEMMAKLLFNIRKGELCSLNAVELARSYMKDKPEEVLE